MIWVLAGTVVIVPIWLAVASRTDGGRTASVTAGAPVGTGGKPPGSSTARAPAPAGPEGLPAGAAEAATGGGVSSAAGETAAAGANAAGANAGGDAGALANAGRDAGAQAGAAAPGGLPPAGPVAKFTAHVVQAGDTLGAIAQRHAVKLETLFQANDLRQDDILSPGRTLWVPAAGGALHRVMDGDTLWDLAMAYGVDPDAVVRANPDVEPGALQIGTWLLIPGATTPPPRLMLASRAGAGDRRANPEPPTPAASPRPDSAPAPAPPAPPAATPPAPPDSAPAPAPPDSAPTPPAPTPPGPGASLAGKFAIWPLRGPITDPFGWRIHPVYGTRNFHDAIDISGPVGAPIVAVAPGKVTLAEWYGGWGLTVRIDHGGGLVTRYSHAAQILVKVGEQVNTGQVIARVGSTGVSTGPHLDFGVYRSGKAEDPVEWLP